MTSDMVVHKDERGIELRRSAVIGNDLDAEPASTFASESRIACSKPGAAISSLTVWTSMPSNRSSIHRQLAGSPMRFQLNPWQAPAQ